MAELEASSDYRARRAAIDAFNATSPVLKKGLALTPVKFGIAFNVTHLNQAGALVHVYVDGSILVNHGGTEMGQGINTKVMQVVAHELGVDLAHVRATATDTSKVANTSATAASTGADLNGKAAQDAARQIRERLARIRGASSTAATAGEVRFAADTVYRQRPWRCRSRNWSQKAYLARVQLWSDGFYATPGLHWDPKTMNGHPFSYFAYGAAVSEVVVDTLTGEWKLLRADALYDAGNSLNPAIDIGQVEGAFIQGMGWLTTEELWWNPAGKLMTHAPSTYKIPACPTARRTSACALFDNGNVEDSIHRSKAVGEPPLLLPFSVFFAIRDAISSVGGHQVNPPLNAPATSEAILDAIASSRRAAGAARDDGLAAAPSVTCRRAGDGGDRRRARCRASRAPRCWCAPTRFADTIGGGHLEHARARDRARDAGAMGERAHASSALRWARAWASAAAACVHLAFERVDAAQVDAAAQRAAASTAGASSRSTARSSAPCSTTRRPLAGRRPRRRSTRDRGTPRDAGARTGAAGWSTRCLAPRAHLVLFGAGHVGAAIVRALAELPCRVTWVDERDDMFPAVVPANVTVEATDTPEALVAAAPRRRQLPRHDPQPCARPAPGRSDPGARADVGWFGLIGSHTKRRQFERRLRAARRRRRAHRRHGLPDRPARHHRQGAGRDRRLGVRRSC